MQHESDMLLLESQRRAHGLGLSPGAMKVKSGFEASLRGKAKKFDRRKTPIAGMQKAVDNSFLVARVVVGRKGRAQGMVGGKRMENLAQQRGMRCVAVTQSKQSCKPLELKDALTRVMRIHHQTQHALGCKPISHLPQGARGILERHQHAVAFDEVERFLGQRSGLVEIDVSKAHMTNSLPAAASLCKFQRSGREICRKNFRVWIRPGKNVWLKSAAAGDPDLWLFGCRPSTTRCQPGKMKLPELLAMDAGEEGNTRVGPSFVLFPHRVHRDVLPVARTKANDVPLAGPELGSTGVAKGALLCGNQNDYYPRVSLNFFFPRLIAFGSVLALLLAGLPWRTEPVGDDSGCCSAGGCCCADAEDASCCSGEKESSFRVLLKAACGCGGHSQDSAAFSHKVPVASLPPRSLTPFAFSRREWPLLPLALFSVIPQAPEPPPPRHSIESIAFL